MVISFGIMLSTIQDLPGFCRIAVVENIDIEVLRIFIGLFQGGIVQQT